MYLREGMGYVEKVQGVHGLLRPGGRFVASITHPCTDTPFRVWERDGGGKKRWLCIDRYFERGPLEYTWSGWGREFTTEAIHATLEDSAGFRGCCKGALLSVFRLGASMDGLMEVLLKQGVSPCRSKHDCNSVLAIAKAAPDRYGLRTHRRHRVPHPCRLRASPQGRRSTGAHPRSSGRCQASSR